MKCLLFKAEDLSSDPCTHVKAVTAYVCKGLKQKHVCLQGSLAASLIKMVKSRLRERASLSSKGCRKIEGSV